MREIWKYSMSNQIVFGFNAVRQVGKIAGRLGGKKVLIVTDQNLARTHILDRVREPLAQENMEVSVFDGGREEPPVEVVQSCLDSIKGQDFDVVIGLGGGSNIDLAKSVSVVLQHGGKPQDYFGESKVPGSIKPLIAVSTTSGTGSEVSPVAVLTDTEKNMKVGISDNYIRPRVAVFDPILTETLPPSVTAASGIDALCHAVESYMCIDHAYLEVDEATVIYNGRSPLTGLLAERSIQLVAENLRKAVHQGKNLEARKNMALGNLLAGMAFTNSGVTIVHALAYPVGAITHAPHGVCNEIFLPHVMEYNINVRAAELARVAELMGVNTYGLDDYEAAALSVEAVKKLSRDIGLPSRLSEIGVKESHVKEIAAGAFGIDRIVRGNPRRVTLKDMEDVTRAAL